MLADVETANGAAQAVRQFLERRARFRDAGDAADSLTLLTILRIASTVWCTTWSRTFR